MGFLRITPVSSSRSVPFRPSTQVPCEHPVHQPEPKLQKKTLSILTAQFKYLAPRSNQSKGKKSQSGNDEVAGEYQQLMDQEFFDFVVYEVPWIVD
jgi:V-type H+-transporting ATPase subunit C